MAMSTSWILGCSWSSLFQKKMYWPCSSLSYPSPAQQVSLRETMSKLNLFSSRTIKAVLSGLLELVLSISIWMFHAWRTFLIQFKSCVTQLNIHCMCASYWLRASSLSLACSHCPSPIAKKLGNFRLAHRTRCFCMCLTCIWCCTPGNAQFYTSRPTESKSKENNMIGVEKFLATFICLHSYWDCRLDDSSLILLPWVTLPEAKLLTALFFKRKSWYRRVNDQVLCVLNSLQLWQWI